MAAARKWFMNGDAGIGFFFLWNTPIAMAHEHFFKHFPVTMAQEHFFKYARIRTLQDDDDDDDEDEESEDDGDDDDVGDNGRYCSAI